MQLTVDHLAIVCGASTQEIYAVDSEIVLEANALSVISQCVATHGGAIAPYGESYVHTSKLPIRQHYNSSETMPLREEGPSMLNGSNHWILRQLAKVNKIPIQGQGTEVLLMATGDCLPSHPTKDGRTTQTAVSPFLGLISVVY